MGEQKAKALVAGGVALFVTGLVIMALVVIPAARHTNLAMAQGDDGAEPGGGAAYPGPGEQGAPGAGGPGGEGPGAFPGEGGMDGMDGMGMPGGGGAAAPAAPAAPVGPPVPPLEPSRPNPFSTRAGTAASAAAASSATIYGPDWSRLPIAEHMAFVTPEIPSAPTPPAPRISARGGETLRVTSILWDANGQAQAAYETDEGRSGVLKPGDRIEGSTVVEITRTGVTLENRQSGTTRTLELRSRSKKPASSTNRPGARGGNRAPRGFPGAPPA